MMTDMLRVFGEHETSDRVGGSVASLRLRTVPLVDLSPTIASEVIPRLRRNLEAALSMPRHPLVAERRMEPLADKVEDFATRLLDDDIDAARAIIDPLQSAGCPLERLYLELVAPAAVHISRLFGEDLCGLADATVAFCNLQRVLRHYAPEFYAEAGKPETGLRSLLVSPKANGDAGLSVFGLLLMSEFFRREGWDAWIERNLDGSSFRNTVLSEWFDLVEILATSDGELDEIASGIRMIRRASPNPSVGVIACGRVFREHPEFVRMVGADLSASDPLTSLSQARQFVTRTTQLRRLA